MTIIVCAILFAIALSVICHYAGTGAGVRDNESGTHFGLVAVGLAILVACLAFTVVAVQAARP